MKEVKPNKQEIATGEGVVGDGGSEPIFSFSVALFWTGSLANDIHDFPTAPRHFRTGNVTSPVIVITYRRLSEPISAAMHVGG